AAARSPARASALPALADVQRARIGDLALPAPAPRKSGRLAAGGRRGVGARERAGQPPAGVDRILLLPLVPGDGRRVLRGRAGGAALDPSNEPISRGALEEALARLHESFDAEHGGFGRAPKFPPASAIDFLLLRGEREMALHTLAAMARGGIHDQLGGGFSRY